MRSHLSCTRIPMLAVLACLALAALAVAESAAAATPVQRATRTCSHPAYFLIGSSQGYFRELRVTNVTCRFGNTLIKAHLRCRNPGGKKPRGTCRSVRGFRCSEGKRTFSPDGAGGFSDFSVRVTCRRRRG